MKVWRSRWKEKDLTGYRALERKYNLMRYRVTAEQWSAMLEAQGHLCKLCGCAQDSDRGKAGRGFAVDHCHTTGIIRGLLCHGCNAGLGAFGDDPELIEKAKQYLNDTFIIV